MSKNIFIIENFIFKIDRFFQILWGSLGVLQSTAGYPQYPILLPITSSTQQYLSVPPSNTQQYSAVPPKNPTDFGKNDRF